MRTEAIERVLAALEDIRQGKMVILTDDEDRENEGDLVMAAELCTPETINFMARHARGLICLSLTEDRCDRLELPMMVGHNKSSRSTAFTVSIEARHGVSTGISAADRAHTIRTAVAPDVRPSDLVSPGHVFPLRAKPGGVLQRTGHTEGSVDLARLAGLDAAGVICEIMNDDGTMARYDDLVGFAETHGLRLLSIADLIEYRLSRERLVRVAREGEVKLPGGGAWKARVYEVLTDARQFLALVHGEIDREPTLVRVHTASVLGDMVGLEEPSRVQMREAVEAIEAEGKGVILLLPSGASLGEELAFFLGHEAPHRPRPQQGEVLREYGLGAQVLADLGLGKIRILTNRPRRIPSLDGYGLEVVEQKLVREDG
ncbi:MAG TPA: 3,4-dihydroxy-2-butanone-4-phosphate synthase [Polyangiaceae bacterium LLY-WYZ-15_(1-7)]|nr:3,4-dihydroxy-2-butanone-4-phosphate synthase [Polyangiaceae bacterium LLY-WYZ-15_(1-7)]HJL05282.1 3,4-dihydroxy-2-butanone-4-phosphate synthase [Polyangiaceae bacterium LLY-WYZ-15_(1-7)]HJL07900.1 3,4-dihydroxy-2-butanone-4-phosphate synthase [Polyangiaceae bacterium LLY-WYZ-15_(1-7)]HJL23443.1 3,4-dihydroxy-2-butanone-4-phosphate synthase [Polyangiaceae bacterium LLY-WYZ-15_(1-7)]HJL32813.1 3,4-dihydroxy-2-butanone-4-phosphate synthase [Polyangiaceae bacterium LLY-WYZ-15_(1-7)]